LDLRNVHTVVSISILCCLKTCAVKMIHWIFTKGNMIGVVCVRMLKGLSFVRQTVRLFLELYYNCEIKTLIGSKFLSCFKLIYNRLWSSPGKLNGTVPDKIDSCIAIRLVLFFAKYYRSTLLFGGKTYRTLWNVLFSGTETLSNFLSVKSDRYTGFIWLQIKVHFLNRLRLQKRYRSMPKVIATLNAVTRTRSAKVLLKFVTCFWLKYYWFRFDFIFSFRC